MTGQSRGLNRGWADIGFLLDGDVSDLHAEFQDVDGAETAGARNVEHFLA